MIKESISSSGVILNVLRFAWGLLFCVLCEYLLDDVSVNVTLTE